MNCNPDKFKAHFEKFPEKYQGKILKIHIEDKELVGGGGGIVDQVRTVRRKKNNYLNYLLFLLAGEPMSICRLGTRVVAVVVVVVL